MTTKEKSKTEAKAKIIVVDDHPIVRQGLAQLIDQEPDMEFVGEAGDAIEAMKVMESVRPDLAIVDISLKGATGLELTKNIGSDFPKVPVLIISMFDEGLYAERALRAGAKGYLMKQEATENVVTAIRKILKGEIYVSDRMNESLLNRFIGNKVGGESSVQNLSNRELEILQLIGQGRGTRQIAEDLHVSIKTVESHYAKIKEKLNLQNANELIQYAVNWFNSQT